MARSGVLLALSVLATAACAQARGMMTGGGMMPSKSSGGGGGGSDHAVFSRGRATSGDAYLAACAPDFRSELPAWLAPARH